jgi:tRNA(Arg) A34 adenosine deaminase TadA
MSTSKPAQTAPAGLEKIPGLPILDTNAPLAKAWDKPVFKIPLIEPTNFDGGDGERERHTIYSLALMKLVKEYWNGNKKGITGEYPGRPDQLWAAVSNGTKIYRPNKQDDPLRPGIRPRDYMGHNIAAIAVDGDGDIIDFEFNHNEVFCSGVEHAESRLIRRIFSLALLDEGWNLAGRRSSSKPATNLSNVTVYTSLEPCAQCAGIMTLCGVKNVVYLQRDFGTYCISNILYNLTGGTGIPAPRPIPAGDFGLKFYDDLNQGFEEFNGKVGNAPFWVHPTDNNQNDKSPSVTSFLCTDAAYGIYDSAASHFDKLHDSLTNEAVEPEFQLQHREYPHTQQPAETDGESTAAHAENNFRMKTNEEVLKQAFSFVEDAVRIGRRGTPHQL